jgi:hypothetical protein
MTFVTFAVQKSIKMGFTRWRADASPRPNHPTAIIISSEATSRYYSYHINGAIWWTATKKDDMFFDLAPVTDLKKIEYLNEMIAALSLSFES